MFTYVTHRPKINQINKSCGGIEKTKKKVSLFLVVSKGLCVNSRPNKKKTIGTITKKSLKGNGINFCCEFIHIVNCYWFDHTLKDK